MYYLDDNTHTHICHRNDNCTLFGIIIHHLHVHCNTLIIRAYFLALRFTFFNHIHTQRIPTIKFLHTYVSICIYLYTNIFLKRIYIYIHITYNMYISIYRSTILIYTLHSHTCINLITMAYFLALRFTFFTYIHTQIIP